MNRTPSRVVLQDENTWSSFGQRIVFDDDCALDSSDHLIGPYIVGRPFAVAVPGDQQLSPSDKRSHAFECRAHSAASDAAPPRSRPRRAFCRTGLRNAPV